MTRFTFQRLKSIDWRTFVLLALLWCSTPAPPTAAQPSQQAAAEIRAFWVDAFHPGIRTSQEAGQLVADAKRAGVNTLFVQVRRRGDALYKESFEPPLDDPAYDPQFDALANIIEVAHKSGIQVHAWMNAMPVWRDEKPPRDARHVFNQHGPAAEADARWLTASPKGELKFLVGYFLDPGHPAAAAYLAEVYLNVVRKYPALDGIHFDYVRYPETAEVLPRGAPVGYNAVNLARFRVATGKAADYVPDPSDQAWIAWRRMQVTQLVRRVYIEAKAINPRIKVSAALIPWGAPPTNEQDFENVAPMQRIFQDWHSWLKEGILDLAVPMNYSREHDPPRRDWFNGWIAWEKQHKHGRQLAVGIGAYVNTPANTLAQVARVRQKKGRHTAHGVSFFSYASMFAPAPPPGAAAAGAPPAEAGVRAGAAFPAAAAAASQNAPGDRVAFLAEGAGSAKGAFAQPAAVPQMDWIASPQTGWVAGALKAGSSTGHVRAVVKKGIFSRAYRVDVDGNGWFGFTGLKPGRYKLWMEMGKQPSAKTTVEVTAGKVARPSGPEYQ